METTTEEFVNSFHQINGTTIGERRRNLFSLLNRTNAANVVFESIDPKSSLEESFKIETLLRFNKTSNLIEILKSENPKLINKLMSLKFVERIFEYVDETCLVEDYFPYFSFNTKLKLINKLSFYVKDEKKADTFFWAIEKKYGFYLATKLLPCCSESLILKCVESLKFELTPKQLLFIVKKHPHLTLDILKALKRYTDATVLACKYKLVFVHILKTDLTLFLKVQEEYPCNLRVGWRSTQKIITASKDRVAEKAIAFHRYLHTKQLGKSFSNDFPKFYANMFPSSLSVFKADVSYYVKLLEHIPGEISKIELLLNTFQDTYNCDILKAGCVHQSVLELMPNDERQLWIDSHPKPDNISEEVWVCLMKTEKSIPALKEIISSKSDIKDRSELVGCLVESCRINNDQEALMNLCKYMLLQHRNDNSSVLLSFLNTIKSCYDLNTLSEAIWKSLIELCTHLSLREEVYYQHNDWFSAYINYLILKDILTKDKFVLLMKKTNNFSGVHFSMKPKHVQKKFLLTLGKTLSDLYAEDELKNSSMQFIQTILQWNKKERHDTISLAPYESAFDYFKKQVEDYSAYQYLATDVVLQLMRSNISDKSKQHYLGCLFKKKHIYIEIDLLLWLIKEKPIIVVEHFEGITKILLRLKPTKGVICFWSFCCNYVHLNLPQRIAEMCLDLLNKDDNEFDKKNIVLALSCLLEPQRFLELIEFYYPNELIMDVNSDDQNLYKTQQGIMIALKNIVPPSITFDSILRFSKGDYMKFIQRTLHSVSLNAAENRLIGFFPSFRDHPVSVRKHAIYQTFKVMDKSEIFSMLNLFKRNEKNSSIIKLLFKGIFNYFIKNPGDHSFDLLKEQLKSIDVSDEEAFQMLLSVGKVPFKYLPEYLVFSYRVFETLPEVNAKVIEGKTQLLNSITSEVIVKVSEDFSWSIVCKLFADRTGFGDAVQDFSCRFLAYGVNRVADVFRVVKEYVVSFWCSDKDKFVARKQINSFVHKLCAMFIKDRNVDKQRLEIFASLWNDFMKPYEAFDVYLEMYFSLGVLEEKDLLEIVLNLGDLLNEYDCVIAFDVAKVLSTYISNFLKGVDDYFELDRLEFILTLINSGKRFCMLLGVSLLPYSFPSNFRIAESYETVLRENFSRVHKMNTATEDFMTSFHQINGTTIGERRKNFLALLNRTNDVNVDFESIEPKTSLEEIFKIETLLHFNKTKNLIEVLKSEKPKLINKLMKLKILKHIFECVDETSLVEDYFPYFSFNTKVKLINKLSFCIKDEKKADALLGAIEKKYGFYLATKLLPCSCKYKLVFVHVLKTDLALFLKIQAEYPCNLRLGWRSTQKIVTASKDRVADKAAIFYRYFHTKQMVKSFSNDFPKFYANMFPSSLSCFQADIPYYVSLLEHIPRGVSKINLLRNTFQDTYNCDIWKSGCVHQSVLELMSNDERQLWIDSHPKPDNVSEEVWICLMKTEKSIPALKELIFAQSDIKERSQLVGCLVETCRINNDQEALKNLCKHMLSHHRNDNSSVPLSFLNSIKVCYDLNTLSEALWECLIDLVNYLMLRDDVYHQHNDWFFAYINYLIVKDRLTNERFTELMKNINICGGTHFYIQKSIQGDELNNRSVYFVHDVLQWNRRERNDKISLLPYENVIEIFKNQVEKTVSYRCFANDVGSQLMRSDFSFLTKYLEIILDMKSTYINIDLVMWLINEKPTIVVKYFEGITKSLLHLKSSKRIILFWLSCGYYSHLKLPQKMSELCLDLFNKHDNEFDKKNIVLALSCLLEPQRFLKLIEAYYPNDLIMDVNSDDRDLYKTQQGIMIALKNIVPPSITFDSILRFSKGDYMKFIQRTLHSVSLNAAENRLIGFFPSFRDHPVSVRKHAIYQTFKVMDKSEIFSMLNFFKRNEKNSSIIKLLFKGIFNYFIKNPGDHSFDLLKEQLKSIDVSDEEAFQMLLSVRKVPFKYLPEYLVFSYRVFETLPEEYVVSFWCSDKDKFVARKQINSFVHKLCAMFIKDRNVDKQRLEIFASLWNDFMKPYEAFDVYLEMYFSLGVLEEKDVLQIVLNLSDILNEYDCVIAFDVAKVLSTYISNFLKGVDDYFELDRLEFILTLINSGKRFCMLLGVSLLPYSFPSNFRIAESYETVLRENFSRVHKMNTATEDFITSFHQINGTTIGERRTNFLALLNRTNDVNVDFESVEPKTSLEEIFKIETLLHFNKTKNLIEVLKSEKPKLIHKLMKLKILKHIFECVDETSLVEDYFPYFSFNTKVKLINKLSFCIKDEKKADALLGAIEKKYGFYLATKLLPCCSGNLILQCVQSLRFELTPKQLLFIVKKHPHLTLDILKALKRYTDGTVLVCKYKLVFVHVLKTDLALFLKIQAEYPCNLRLGWRSTQKIVTASKDRVANKAAIFYRYFHTKQMVKSFSNDFPKFYANMFPSSLSCFQADIPYYVSLLEHIPRGVSKINLLRNTFQDTYNCDIWKSGCVHQSVLELMSNDERQLWIDSHPKPDNVSEEVWICLMKTEKSIPALKELIFAQSDIKERSQLVGCLVETCRINNDQEALKNLCKHMLSHHRNDNSSVPLSFLNSIKVCYDLNTLSEALWECLIDLVNYLMLRDDVYHQHNDWFFAYINYLIVKDRLTNERFTELMKNINICGGTHFYIQKCAMKKFLLNLGEVLPGLYKGDELNNRSVYFVHDVLQWNRRERNDKISLLPYENVIEIFKNQVEKTVSYRCFANDVGSQLMRSDFSFLTKYLEIILDMKPTYINIDLVMWLINEKPTIVVKYFEGITKSLLHLKSSKRIILFWLSCGYYSHLKLPQKMSELCLDLFNKHDNEFDKKNTVLALSCLLEPQRFLKLIEVYYPNDLIMDVNSDDRDLYKTQQGIMIALKNILPPSITFDSILRFSKGDYMKFIQRTLHSVSLNAAENRLIGFFPSFRDHPVSVRKHAIYQTFKVMDKLEIFSMLNFFKRNEKNSSIIKLLFKGIFNYFIKNPGDHSFDLLKEQLKSIDVSDEEAFQMLLSVRKVPFKYLPEYLVFSYRVFETLPEVNAKVVEGKTQLLNSITSEIIVKVSEDFSWNIVCKLFADRTGFGDAVQDFSCRFLAYGVNRVADVFRVVKEYVVSFWCSDKDKFVARKQINSFVHKLCAMFIRDRSADQQRLKIFASLWNDFMKPYEAFDVYLEMYFSLGVLEEKDVLQIVLNLSDILNEYDCVIAFDVAKVLSTYISNFLKGVDDYFELDRLEFILTLMNSGKRFCMLLGVFLLPYSFPSNFRIAESYETVLRNTKMKMSGEEFVSQFQSLQGANVGEMRKNLFRLLNNFQEKDFDDFDFLKLQPRNVLEENFKISVLIYFKRVPELLAILKGENPEHIERVFKIDRWFFQRAFGNVTGKDLVEGLFPFVSFNVKVKLMNKLSELLTDTQQADGIFNEVKNLYGLHLASKILPACSFDLVIAELETHKLKLPPKQLNHIMTKHPESRYRLLKTIDLTRIDKQYNNVLKLLSEIDFPFFLELQQKSSRKLGRRNTTKFYSLNKDAIMNNPKEYLNFLNNKQVAKCLGKDFRKFFENLFPNDIQDFTNNAKFILSKLNLLSRKENALELYFSTFKLKYGSEIWDHPEIVTVKLLKMLDPKEKDERIKEEYRPSGLSEDEWMCLYKIQTSVPFLKKRISLTSDMRTRAQLVGYLVETCKINQDKTALANICKYVLSKHRNDNIHVRVTFLRRIQDNFVLENLEDEHWQPINELIDIFHMNQESFHFEDSFLEAYIHYRLRSNLPIKEYLMKWLANNMSNLNLTTSVPEFEKKCLQTFGEIIPEVAKDHTLFVRYLCALHEYNCRNENDQIPLFAYPRAIEALKQHVAEFAWEKTVSAILILFFKNANPEEKSQYLKLVLLASNRYSKCNIVDDLLKKEPALILENMDVVMHFILKAVNTHKNIFLKRVRYYSHWNVPQAAIKYCMQYENYQKDCPHYEKKIIEESAFTALSFFKNKDDFMQYLFNFYPAEKRACSDKNKFLKQKLLCFNIRNIFPVSDAVSAILKFCKGDYFKFALGSLYSICGNLNEDKLMAVLNDLSNHSVSVQKHSLHLSYRHMNRQIFYGAINKYLERKTNISARKFILKALFNFFSKNPDGYIWNLLKISVENLDESDKEAFDLFLQINKIPKDYLSRYQEFAWNVLLKLPNPNGELDSKRASILNSVDNEGSQILPDDFSQNIINSLLFRSDDLDYFQISVQTFTCKYIIYCKNQKQKQDRLKSVFALMKYFIDNKWTNPQYREKTRSCCSKFLQTFCSEFLNNRSDDQEVLQSLFEMWNGLFPPHEAFSDYLHLKFALMHSQMRSLEQFSKDFLVLCNDLTASYSVVIVELLHNEFNKLIDLCLSLEIKSIEEVHTSKRQTRTDRRRLCTARVQRDDKEVNCNRYEFIENLVKYADSDVGLLMAILFLRGNDCYDSKVSERRNQLIEKLENNKKVVKMGLTTEEFLTEFHALAGLTKGEKKKNLFALLNDNVDGAFDFSMLKPQSLFEQILKFEVLKFYKNHSELLEMMLEENPTVIQKIFKLQWFVKDTFESMEPERLISEIFPNLSYNAKVKLLNRMCLFVEDASKIDEYFWSIKEAYGRYLAFKLLPACSETLIINVMDDNTVELTPKQLMLMINRNPSHTEDIFERLYNYDRKVDIADKYKDVFRHIMQNDVSAFIRLNEKYGSTFKLGWRATRKFVTNNKDVCLNNSEKLYKLLKETEIAKCLKHDFAQFYANIFPKSLENLVSDFDYFTSILQNLKDEDKLNLLFDTFKHFYNEDLLNYYQFMVPKVFEWMSSDYKDDWLENHSKPKEIPEETWISFMATAKSIPLLKEKIKNSNVTQREELVKALVITCKINRDEVALEEVCEYMVEKHSDDNHFVRKAFLEEVMHNFNLKKLQEQHWKYLNELVKSAWINDDFYFTCVPYFESYISICFDKGLPYEDYIKLWLEHGCGLYSLVDEDLKFQKRFHEVIVDIFPLCYSGDELKTQMLDYTINISSWNNIHPKQRISLFNYPDVVENVLERIRNSEVKDEEKVFAMTCLMTDYEKAKELNLLEVLASKPEEIIISVQIEWFLKHHHSDVLPLIKPLMKQMLKTSLPHYKAFNQIVDPEMIDAVTEVCKEKLESDEDDVKIRSIQVLSVVLPPQEFLQVLKEHLPQDLPTSKFQKFLPKMFTNVIPAHAAFESVVEYCQGDYLKWTRDALYDICSKSAEKRLRNFIDTLSTLDIPAKKHSMIIALTLTNKEDTSNFLKDFVENEESEANRKRLLKSILKLISKNPEDCLWQLLVDKFESLFKDDVSVTCKLTKLKRIPKDLFPNYVLFTWNVLDALPSNENVDEEKTKILEMITQTNILWLPNDFCRKLICDNIFQVTHTKLSDELSSFTCKYLIYFDNDFVDEVLCIMKKVFRSSCKNVNSFVITFCEMFIKEKIDRNGVLASFANNWNDKFQPHESLENYLYIHFTLIWLDSLESESIEAVGGRIAEICNNIFDIQSLDVYIFADVFTNFKNYSLLELSQNWDDNYSLLLIALSRLATLMQILL
ncbi:hypothetical protein FQR65_LT08196 [Abscondita terminalis]|nr:hypothetical protein FQR65_LT08196 [Abscondita terminalis]